MNKHWNRFNPSSTLEFLLQNPRASLIAATMLNIFEKGRWVRRNTSTHRNTKMHLYLPERTTNNGLSSTLSMLLIICDSIMRLLKARLSQHLFTSICTVPCISLYRLFNTITSDFIFFRTLYAPGFETQSCT